MGVGASSSRIAKLKKKADEHFNKGKYDRALSLYQKIIDDDPADVFVHQRIADCYERLNQKGDAIQALLQLADVFQEDGRLMHALATLRRAQRMDPGNIDVLEKMAEFLMRQNNLLEAKNVYQQLIDLYYRQNRLTKVLETLEKLLKINPNDFNLHFRLAQINVELGKEDEAAKIYSDLTMRLLDSGQFDEAVRVCEQGLKHFPDHPTLKNALFSIYLQNEQYEELIKLYRSIKEPEVDHTLKAARAYAGLQQYDQCNRLITEALRKDPENEEIYRMMLRILPENMWEDVRAWIVGFLEKSVAQGKTSLFWDLLDDALKAKPDDQELIQLAISYLGQYQQETKSLEILDRAITRSLEAGNLDRALELIDKILAVDPDNEQYREKRDYIVSQMEQPSSQVDSMEKEPLSSQPTVEEVSEYIDQEEIKDYILGQITEAEVFYRYGMIQKATDELERLIRQYPLIEETEQAYRKIYRIYLNEGLHDRAVDKLFQLANFYQHHGMTDKIPEVIDEIRSINPNDERLEKWEDIVEAASVNLDEYLDISSEIDGLSEEIADTGGSELELSKQIEEVNFYLQQGLLDNAKNLFEQIRKKYPEHPDIAHLAEKIDSAAQSEQAVEMTPEEIEFEIELELEEPEPIELEEESVADDVLSLTEADETINEIPTPESFQNLIEESVSTELDVESGAPVTEEKDEIVLEESKTAVKTESTETREDDESSRISPASDTSKDRSTVDDLIEALIQTAVKSPHKKARKIQEKGADEVLQKVLSDLSKSVQKSMDKKEEAVEELSEVEQVSAPQQGVEETTLEPSDAVSVVEIVDEVEDSEKESETQVETGSSTDELSLEFMDLAGELEQEILQVEEAIETTPDEQISLALSQLKQKIDEVVPEDDARTHFDLGQAYILMDLIDEAIVEFQKAERNPQFMVDANYQLAECFIRKGLPDAAVRCYRKILESPTVPVEQRSDVLYRLGCLLEEMGETEQAYEVFLELLSSNASYKDVKDKVSQLESVRQQKPH